MMKNSKKITFVALLATGVLSAQQQFGSVGINTNNPQAALDIQTHDQNQDKVLRVSTPLDIDADSEYTIFVGKPVKNGSDNVIAYDLRKLSLSQLVDKFKIAVPSFNNIVVTNSQPENFTATNQNTPITLNEELVNSNNDMFEFVPVRKSIKIKIAGYYEVSSFVGFEQLLSYEGDIIVSVALKKANQSNFTNFKRNVISRTDNGSVYRIGRGVGSSFSFVEKFDVGDELILQVNRTFTPNLRLLEYGASMSVKRITPLEGGVSVSN